MKALRLSWQRGTAMALAAALAFVLVGDRARAGLIPGVGIDPLEVMDLQVKPNVIIVLDSSGSMTETPLGAQTNSGDHPRSKLGQAKDVLKQVIANNDKKASFLFGQYTSNSTQNKGGQGTAPNPAGRGGDRWFYGADSIVSPSMLTTEVVLDYYAFQVITATNNRFVFGEEIGASGTAESICQFLVPPGFYTPGTGAGTLAQALQTGMNAPASCTVARPSPNAYTVNWNAGSRRFDYVDSGGGTHRYRIAWASVAPVPTIRPFITNNVTATPGFTNNAGTYTGSGASLRLSRRDATMKFNDTVVTSPGPPPVSVAATFYTLFSTRFWNGQTLHVLPPPSLTVCDVTNGPAGDGTPANPWYFNVAVRATCAGASGTPVKFTFFGTRMSGNSISCGGFKPDVPLIPCDQTTPTQVSTIAPFLQPQVAVTVGNTAVTCAGGACPITAYSETSDGLFDEVSQAALGGVASDGSTPVIQTIADVHGLANNLPGGLRPQRNFAQLWFAGQPAVPGPAITPISTHPNPKERTILLFITDGDPTCSNPTTAPGVSNNLALGSAWSAEQAFKRLDAAEAASSLSTYFVAFGNGASVTRANWIAWGGSGFTSQMVASINGGTGSVTSPTGTVVSPTAPPVGPPGTEDYIRWAVGPTATDKAALCPTCIDAFIAPDAPTLIAQLESILNQGASTGEFSAQQSVTSNVYEYTGGIVGVDSISGAPFDPANPTTRLRGFVPTRFVSTFTVPGFQGQFRAFTDIDGDGAVDGPGPNGERWSAGDKLVSLVTTGRNGTSGMNACSSSGTPGECTFLELHANAGDANLATSTAAIKRRIYTTSGNGNFGVTAQNAINLTSPLRAELWPPTDPLAATPVAPNSNTTAGLLDSPLTLPTNVPLTLANFTALQTQYHACKGIGLGGVPVDAAGSGHPCSASNSAAVRAGRARREAREMIVSFLAGAKFVQDAAGDPKRLTTGTSEILYAARGWMLAEGTLSTPAVVAPPIADTAAEEPATVAPAKFDDEYRIFRDGLREGTPPVNPVDAIKAGIGLRNPDKDSAAPIDGTGKPTPDLREDLKPVMTVVYVGTNLMLHAFRAGPCTTLSTTCTETGGEELWAFVPYDKVGSITKRYLNDPQPRNPHEFAIAASLRFGDVFVPHVPNGPGDPPLVLNVGPTPIDFNSACDGSRCDGVWRRILYVGRGFGGKYWTAIDVTGPGMYTQDSLSTNPPLVYWSRGNPDTVDGKVGGPAVDVTDTAAYATMGQTWSVPAVNFVDKTGPSGVNFVLNMGSGFSDLPAEGHDFYTVDALTGHMIARVDVDAAATSIGQGLPRAAPLFPTALVANVAGFSKARFFPGRAFHPARDFTTRNYFGDVQGRLWKVLVAAPTTAIPIADIGTDQPLGAPLGLFGLLGTPGAFTAAVDQVNDIPLLKPAIFGSSGNDNRIPLDPDDPVPQFKNFALFDSGTDTDVSPGTAAVVGSGIRVFGPNTAFLFDRVFDPGSNFRGTLQPTTAALDKVAPIGQPDGVVAFFGGTRFNPIGSPFVVDPCRSTFDSIVFAFDINTGGKAFDLQSADDTYTIFQDSRLVGIFTTYSPDTGSGGKLVLDEGLVKGAVQAPPPAGQPAGTTTSNFSVIQTIRPNSPMPGVRFGSTVCQ